MKNPHWARAIKSAADPQRAKQSFDLLAATSVGEKLLKMPEEQVRILTALFSGSPALSNHLVANPGWLASLDPEALRHPRREQGFRQEVDLWLTPLLAMRDYGTAFTRLRQFKQRQMLRIATRDLARLANVPEITRELSDLADVCLDGVLRVCREQLGERHGEPYFQDEDGRWHPGRFCVLGLGKLGGQELNYSSDVDVIFIYTDEGQVFKEPPAKAKQSPSSLTNHQFFTRLVEAFVAELTRMTADGMLYRIDLRLRPEGDAGPLSRSLPSYENYYAQWGQIWERMMLIKARGVAGDRALAAEFLEMIQPFRFPRSIGGGVLREIAAMKERIENEVVKAGELDRNVKLGRGGIREIEFTAQTLQLLHGGRMPFLQISQTLPSLEKMAQYKLLPEEGTKQLHGAYCFLRDVEHRLQMEAGLQTHTIPTSRTARERLARLMGFDSLKAFEAALKAHTGHVRRIYGQTLKDETPKTESPFPREFDGAEAEWKQLLGKHWFRDTDKAFRVLKEFVEGPGYVHVSQHTVDLARQLLPKIFALCRKDSDKPKSPTLPPNTLSDPDRVVTRLDSFIASYGARASLFEMWNSNPTVFGLMLLLFDRSEFLAEVVIRTPDLVDDLVAGERLRQRKTAPEILADLRHGLKDEDQFVWLRRYHEAELLRIGMRDILGLADFEQNLLELSALADACLQYALDVVMQKHQIKTPPFVIIGLGKLGGCEINYGSDLDLMFIADSKAKELPKLQRLAVEVMDLMSRRTEQGIVFHTDARLRPDGEKGLLVNTLAAYEEYYRRRAQLWEIQAISRTRPVAGDMRLGQQFQALAAKLTDFSKAEQASSPSPIKRRADTQKRERQEGCAIGPSCFTPDWKKQIHLMRMRIENERTPRGKDELAIKTGKGGLMDAEFIAQALCLEYGWQEAHTLRALERARDTGVLPGADKLLENYRQLRRLEGILRRWSYEGETVLPDDPAPYYRVSVRCGFSTPEAFRNALAKWRQAIREVYEKVFAR